MKFIAGLLTIVFSFSVSAREKFIPNPENKIFVKDVISAGVSWVKDKGGKFDFNLRVHNENTDNGMIIHLSDISCQRGPVSGEVKHTFFNTGERTIDFKPNESKDFNLVCRIAGDVTGGYTVKIARVYDNPSLDGKSVGKVIAKDLKWLEGEIKKAE